MHDTNFVSADAASREPSPPEANEPTNEQAAPPHVDGLFWLQSDSVGHFSTALSSSPIDVSVVTAHEDELDHVKNNSFPTRWVQSASNPNIGEIFIADPQTLFSSQTLTYRPTPIARTEPHLYTIDSDGKTIQCQESEASRGPHHPREIPSHVNGFVTYDDDMKQVVFRKESSSSAPPIPITPDSQQDATREKALLGARWIPSNGDPTCGEVYLQDSSAAPYPPTYRRTRFGITAPNVYTRDTKNAIVEAEEPCRQDRDLTYADGVIKAHLNGDGRTFHFFRQNQPWQLVEVFPDTSNPTTISSDLTNCQARWFQSSIHPGFGRVFVDIGESTNRSAFTPRVFIGTSRPGSSIAR